MEGKKRKPILFKIIKAAVRLVYPKMQTVGSELLPKEPCIIVGNHSQMHGPIVGELCLPDSCYIWCASQMMHFKEVPAYAYQDFWSKKPKALRPIFKLASYLIAPIAVLLFNNARTIPVYKDKRIVKTFKESVKRLEQGQSIVIFPEQAEEHNNIVYNFQQGFVDVARLYYKKTGKKISFVPLYIAPCLRQLHFGEATQFLPEADIEQERRRICEELMQKITDIAVALPRHTVIPYCNMGRNKYPVNKEQKD